MEQDTIAILERAAHELYQRQQKWNPEIQEWIKREEALRQAFFQQHRSNPALWQQVLQLLDTQNMLECFQREFYFRAGLQMGMELKSLDLICLKE